MGNDIRNAMNSLVPVGKNQPVPKGLPACVSVAVSLVPVGLSNRYQWKPKAPVDKPGVLRRGHWSRLRGIDWETGSFGPSQPVLKACFLVVDLAGLYDMGRAGKRNLVLGLVSGQVGKSG